MCKEIRCHKERAAICGRKCLLFIKDYEMKPSDTVYCGTVVTYLLPTQATVYVEKQTCRIVPEEKVQC